ncbi:hypothetical protein DRW07_01890 [Alteromonas sediminis]|uniref:Uncharacterized protein n=1 Tax=Alteromonas sediminis TaxID=2259342 RepID=A0A3N5ZAP5_9ALTE|nr:hypothetical protein [Alteromonas sediminis]RPJ68184.1 hypothetical protein DRW07_01890 [Alteromonas sediminis]
MPHSATKLFIFFALLLLLFGCTVPISEQPTPSKIPAKQPDNANEERRPSFLPDAPVGYEWRLIPKHSDEFTTPYLDTAKWQYISSENNPKALIAESVINLGGRSRLNAIRTAEPVSNGYTEWRLRTILPTFNGQLALLPALQTVTGCLTGLQINMSSDSVEGSVQRFPKQNCDALQIASSNAGWSQEKTDRTKFITLGIWRQSANKIGITLDGRPVILESDMHLGSDEAMVLAMQGDMQIDHMRHYVLQKAPNNLLRAPDFEGDDKARHWRLSSPNARFVSTPNRIFTHSYALEIGANSRAMQALVLPSKGTYTLTGFAKKIAGDAGAVVSVIDTKGDVLAQARVVSSQFSPLSLAFNVQKKQPVSIVISNTDKHSVSVLDTLSLRAR